MKVGDGRSASNMLQIIECSALAFDKPSHWTYNSSSLSATIQTWLPAFFSLRLFGGFTRFLSILTSVFFPYLWFVEFAFTQIPFFLKDKRVKRARINGRTVHLITCHTFEETSMNWPRLRPPDLLAFHLLLRMLSRWHLLLLLRDLWCKFQCFITNNMPWDIICTCLVSPKGFLLSYALNCKAAVIWCNLGGINIAFLFIYFLPSLHPPFFLSLDVARPSTLPLPPAVSGTQRLEGWVLSCW